MPRTRAWTPLQRWLIVVGVALCLLAFCAGVYVYERNYRGLRPSALVGTWMGPSGLYYDFRLDGTLPVLDEDRQPTDIKGKWYAGGPNIYVRFPPEILEDRQLVVWHIVDISPDEFRVRAWQNDQPMTYRRAKRPNASNQSLQPTAGRSDD
jgi:hypothetical protein